MPSPTIAQTVQYDSGGATATSLTLDYGDITTINAGDLLLVICGDDADNEGAETQFTALTGFTKKGETGDNTSDAKLAVFYKWATGSESGTFTLSHPNNSDELWAEMHRITGVVGSGDPFDVFTEAAESAGTTFTTGTGTATTADCLYMLAVAFDGGDATFSRSSGDTLTLNTQNNSGTGSQDACGCSAYIEGTTATSYSMVWANGAVNDGWAGYGFAIKPSTDTPRDVTGITEAVTVTSALADVQKGRDVTGLTEVVSVVTPDATVTAEAETPRDVVGITESVTVTAPNAVVSRGREVTASTEAIAVVTPDAAITLGRVVTGITAIVNVIENNADVSRTRDVICTTVNVTMDSGGGGSGDVSLGRQADGIIEVVSIVTADATVTRTADTPRDVIGITEVVTVTTPNAVVSRGRQVDGLTEVIAVTNNDAEITIGREVTGETEIVTLIEAQATVTKDVSRNVVGVTAPVIVTTPLATVALGRTVACSTEAVSLAPNESEVLRGREITGITESVIVVSSTAAIETGRDVAGITDAIIFTANDAVVTSIIETTTPADRIHTASDLRGFAAVDSRGFTATIDTTQFITTHTRTFSA